MNPQRVACAIDVNDFDQAVIDLAASFAGQFDVDLDIIHVTIAPDSAGTAWNSYAGEPHELIRDGRLFSDVCTNVAGVRVHRHHLSGMPVKQVVGFVKRNSPRLLVLGTHARRGIQRVFGSIATRIMRKVDCPVMVLRQTQVATNNLQRA